MTTNFVAKINGDAPAIGTFVTLNTPDVAEILSSCGYDWLLLDMEHGTLTTISVQRMIQAVKGDCAAIIRVPENDDVWIKKALDTGCQGILIPQVNDRRAAEAAVAAAKFPPIGERSVGIARAHGYGMSFAEYVATANETVALIIQIEHIEAVRNLDEILSVEGIDGIFIGPYDLSGSMNMLGNVDSKPVQDVIKDIKSKCRIRSMPMGIFVLSADSVQAELEDGCNFVGVGIDSVLLTSAAQAALAVAKPT